MSAPTANGDSRPSFWPRVRQFAVPPSMIEAATARRDVGDWAGACAAAGVDVDLTLRSVAREYGRELAARLRSDLRHLAPDLLRWHMPRIAPDGLLRPGLTLSLARYGVAGRTGPVHLVVRTPPAWAEYGQRMSLALWDGSRHEAAAGRHPHPRPHRRFRLDLHRHLWDARRAGELRTRSGVGVPPAGSHVTMPPDPPGAPPPDRPEALPPGRRWAVDRWAAEAAILLRAEARPTGTGTVAVRLGAGRRLLLDLEPDRDPDAGEGGNGDGGGPPAMRLRTAFASRASGLPVLPDAATWVPPDLELLRAGLIEPDRLHPLVASALVPDRAAPPAAPPVRDEPGRARLVECRGARHRIGLVDGVLAPLDHDPAELRREELLAALTGTPLPCLQAVDEAHRHPECLDDVRARLDHGDTAGALAAVEALLGPQALLRAGALRDELEAAAMRRITYGMFRAGLTGAVSRRLPPPRSRTAGNRTRPRHATIR